MQLLGGCCFVTLRKNAEYANKSYHVYKVKVVLHIYNKSKGIRPGDYNGFNFKVDLNLRFSLKIVKSVLQSFS